jgi:3-hydroxypropanoate dehydrogenase
MQEALEADAGMREGMGRFSATLQIGTFVMAVRAAGLAAGPMAGFDAAGVDAEFFPDGRWQSLLVVNVGHPGVDPWFDRLPRLAAEDAVAWA